MYVISENFGTAYLHDLSQRRINQLRRHIRFSDYFGTLATILSLMRQTEKLDKQVLHRVEEDLEHLQKKYKILPK
jgi:hypothetical protein